MVLIAFAHRGLAHAFTPIVNTEDLDLEDFPDQFEMLAKELSQFSKAVNEFPEFVSYFVFFCHFLSQNDGYPGRRGRQQLDQQL